jgi:hypothetical protein
MSDQAVVEKPLPAKTPTWQRIWSFLRKHSRKFAYGYATVLLIVVSIQALCLFFLWRPPQDWVSFGARVITSPAIAGIFAVIAASIGSVQLSKQLSHTKEKAADEAWWQQFEWVTDRIIAPPGQKSEEDNPRLPASLAFNLITSLSTVARAKFQKDAVGGILEHYLKDFANEGPEDPDDSKASDRPGGQEEAPPMESASMDSAAADSLRKLVETLPESSRPSASARSVLARYDSENYEQEIARALRHHGFDVTLPGMMKRQPATRVRDADIIATIGNKKIIGEVRFAPSTPSALMNAGLFIKELMLEEGATHCVMFMRPTNVAKLVAPELALQGIGVVLWDPAAMRSFELKRQIDEILEDTAH